MSNDTHDTNTTPATAETPSAQETTLSQSPDGTPAADGSLPAGSPPESETNTRTDGTKATGPGPLPDQSPTQQEANDEGIPAPAPVPVPYLDVLKQDIANAEAWLKKIGVGVSHDVLVLVDHFKIILGHAKNHASNLEGGNDKSA